MSNSKKRRATARGLAYSEMKERATYILAMKAAAKPSEESERYIQRGLDRAKRMEDPGGYSTPITVAQVKEQRGKCKGISPSVAFTYSIRMEVPRGGRTRYYNAGRKSAY